MAKSKTPVKLVSYEEIMGIGDYEEVVTIAIDDIRPFKNHPFKVRDDEKMQELIKSISTQGILTPVTVRTDEDGQYEMISGHRRMHAASMIGNDKEVVMTNNLNLMQSSIIKITKISGYVDVQKILT